MEHASRVGDHFNGTQSPPYWNAASVQTPQEMVPDTVERINRGAGEKDRPVSPVLSHGTTEFGSPDLNSPGLEAIWGLEGDKEVYHAPTPPRSPQPAVQRKRICGLSRKAFWVVLVLGLLVIVGLGAGLGAGLGTRKHG